MRRVAGNSEATIELPVQWIRRMNEKNDLQPCFLQKPNKETIRDRRGGLIIVITKGGRFIVSMPPDR
jgi:hypothetical protein